MNAQKPDALRLAEQYDYGDPVAHSNTWKAAGEYPAITTEFINKHAHPSQAAKLCRADWSGKDESSVETVHPEVIKLLHAYVDADRAMRVQAAPQPAPAPSAAADLIAALEEARSAIISMKVEAETAGQGDEQMMLEACETISNEGLQADMAIRAALASAHQPSPTPQADSQPAPVRDYPPLPDFETVEQHIYGACRRYITQDMLEPIHNLIRDAIDADRASRKQGANHD